MDFVNSAWDPLFKSQTQSKQSLRVCLDRTYFAETENWKHYSKIIFKCVNSVVGPIFNEKIVKKWYLWVREQCMNALFTVEKSTFKAESKKKRETETRIAANMDAANADPNGTLFIIF